MLNRFAATFLDIDVATRYAPQIFAGLLVYSLLGVASDVIVRLIERWALAWRSSFVNP